MRAGSLIPLLLALSLWLLPAAAADASTAPCFPGARGARCHFQTAKVVAVKDGDTVDVDLDGDHSRRTYSIRFRAVQAMELHRYGRRSQWRGECHAVPAAKRVDDLIRAAHRRVRLSAQFASSDHKGRLLRWIAVRLQGRWQDLGEILMREGHTLWMDNTTDTAWNRRYDLDGQLAARAQRNLWNTTACGAGPQQEVPIRVWALSDPPGRDTADGEWIKVQNRSATEALRLGGWWVRDAMLRRFTFPAGTTVAPGATATVHVGSGSSGGNDFFWGLPTTIFENASDHRGLGDGAYLFDPQGDLRAWMLYPCLTACSDPYLGALEVTARPRRPERVLIRNRGAGPVDLYGYGLSFEGSTFELDQGAVLEPGEGMTVFMQGSPARDSHGVRHLGEHGYVLPDKGGWVSVGALNGVVLACDAWGSGSC
jgi:endonuclease YncB( thermonuclease family)